MPCREGGSIFTKVDSRLYARRLKALVVFYTPADADGPASLPGVLMNDPRQSLAGELFEEAISRCEYVLRMHLIRLASFARCILSAMPEFPGCTGVRGLSLVLEFPRFTNTRYIRPGFCSPPGHIYRTWRDLSARHIPPHLRDVTIWITANAPIIMRS